MELRIKSKGVWHTCLFSEQDKDFVLSRKWHVTAQGYAGTNTLLSDGLPKRVITMHRAILGLTDTKDHADHINGNRLDNRRENLRKCTQTENNRNVIPYGKTGYIGVVYDKRKTKNGEWVGIKAQLRTGGKNICIGRFNTEIEAAKARDEASKKYFGEFARLNFPD